MRSYVAINGSPRKRWNTAQLLDAALDGAREASLVAHPLEDVAYERIDLYDLTYTGCRSCFACKLRDGASLGRCAVRDGLAPVLDRVLAADGVVVGSPVYYRDVTGQLHAFWERLLFPYTAYSHDRTGIEPRDIAFAFVYTMNVDQGEYERDGYGRYLGKWEAFASHMLGHAAGRHCAFDTLQFDDYGRYVADAFDGPAKARCHAERWPEELEAARRLGKMLVTAN